MGVRIKVVSDHEPNEGGRWIDITDELAALELPLEEQLMFDSGRWGQMAKVLRRFAPSGTHIVAMDSGTGVW